MMLILTNDWDVLVGQMEAVIGAESELASPGGLHLVTAIHSRVAAMRSPGAYCAAPHGGENA
jgi:hypothetical protein